MNYRHNMTEYTKKQEMILLCLLSNDKKFCELTEKLKFNDMTLSRQLKILQGKKYIVHDHLNRTYKITSKGRDLLGEWIKQDLEKIELYIEDMKAEHLMNRAIGIELQRCNRCDYEFFPSPVRDPKYPNLIMDVKLPKTCPNPKCKSPYWNKPRTKGNGRKK